MATIRYSAEGTISPERFIAALTDFTDRRPALWPNLDTKFYRLHERGDTWAEVTEGTDVLGGVWARERYVDDQDRPRGRREGHPRDDARMGSTLGRAPDGVEKVARVDRLRQEEGAPSDHPIEVEGLGRVAGEEHDTGLGEPIEHPLGKVDPRHARHDHVGDQDVDRLGEPDQPLQGLGAIADGGHLVAGAAQHGGGHVPHRGFILDHHAPSRCPPWSGPDSVRVAAAAGASTRGK